MAHRHFKTAAFAGILVSGVMLAACATQGPEATLTAAQKAEALRLAKAQEYSDAISPLPNPVQVTQTGIRSGYPLIALVQTDLETPLGWSVVTQTGETLASGRTAPLGVHKGSGKQVHRITSFDLSGEHEGLIVKVEGVGTSYPFDVSDDVFSDLKYDMLGYFYQSRSSVPIETAYVEREDLARPAGHPTDVLTCFTGKDVSGRTWPACDYSLDVSGGWYDAADYNKYTVTGSLAAWTMLNLYERGTDGFADGDVAGPDAGNGLNDLLDEARYELDFLMAMQAPEGARAAILFPAIEDGESVLTPAMTDISGLVHHKAADNVWGAIPQRPHEDHSDRALYPPSITATLNLAAVGAQCARIYRDIDPSYTDQCLTAARRAYAAAKKLPEPYTSARFHGSSDYMSDRAEREFYWAAAELYITTGEVAYREDLTAYKAVLPEYPMSATSEIRWNDVLGAAIVSLARSAPDEAIQAESREALVAIADDYRAQGLIEQYAIPIDRGVWPWNSLGSLAARGLLLGTAYDLTQDTRYRDSALDALDYILGRNPLARSYVTGYGEHAVEKPHHRFWVGANAGIRFADYPRPPAGVMVGGPNDNGINGPVSKTILDHCEAETCYIDHIDAYEMNQPSIQVQAFGLWLAAWADDIDRAD